jgi:hypothetical protein
VKKHPAGVYQVNASASARETADSQSYLRNINGA